LKKSLSITLLAILIYPQLSFPQEVNGIVNKYLKVIQVLGDRVQVENVATIDSFLPGDKVVLIQMTGGEKAIDLPQWRTDYYSGIHQCGKFEILQVAEVQKVPAYVVVFTDSVFNAYDNGEKIQLVRMLEGGKVTVKGKVTAREWDGSAGGIIAIIGADTIDLKADIDASGSGFRGGQSENFSPVNCRTYVPDTVNWTESETGRAGHKGEGIVSVAYTFTRGTYDALNGGGSGFGKFSGGGGGSNYNYGGKGGKQYNACPDISQTASGGFNQLDFYRLFCNPLTRRITMGGGGGAGTEDISGGYIASAGGDGGGIIILVTETLLGNGGALKSNGQSVPGVASASAGGGGAGGTILVDAATYSGTFTIEVKGGDGGNTETNCTGAGGSGSGGILWHSGVQLFPGAAVNVNYAAGAHGTSNATYCGTTAQWGTAGGPGNHEDSLLLILNGFLFNTIHGKDTICAGQQPGLITGSSPKGGNGVYTYNWEQSSDGIIWTNASGTRDAKNYQPPVLTQTTHYRRIVTSQDIVDNSLSVKIYVYPAITGNTITGTDTLCYNLSAGPVIGSIPPTLSGGNGNFTYKWLYSTNGTVWDTIHSGSATSADYDPDALTATRYYKRYVQSTKYCNHTSTSITKTVLPSITANSFYTADTTICQSLDPGKLNSKKPGGGDGKYRFTWIQKSASSAWSVITGANDTVYDPGPLDETMRYKRIIASGNDDACVDTSSEKLVTVLDSISNNLIGIDPSRYCAGDNPSEIDGFTPGGGDIGNYDYQWQIRTTGIWSDIAGATYEDFTPQMVETNTQFRRIISSGQLKVAGKYACHDTSPVLSLEVIPYIVNVLGLADQILCQHNTPLPFDPDTATGGYGNITYQWIEREAGSSLWSNAPGISTLSGYTPGSLEKTTYFAREAFSDICKQRSDSVTVTVYPVILNNFIAGSPAVYTCYNTGKALSGPGYSGGKTGDYGFLWLNSTDNIGWNPASGATGNDHENFETLPLTDSLLLRRIIYSSQSGKECADTSAPVTVRINSLPSGDVVSSVDTLCTGESMHIRFNVTGDHGPWDVTIGDGSFRGSKENINGPADSILLEFNETHTIGMIAIVDDSLCAADESGFKNTVLVNVYEIPEADAGPGGLICGNEFELNAAAIPPSYKGLWSVEGGSFTDDTSPVTTVTLDHYGKEYIVWTVTNWQCSNWDTAGVMFYQQPVEIDAGPRQDLDSCRYTTRLEGSLDVGTGHWKVIEGTGIISNDTLPNATISELAAYNLLRWTVMNGVCKEVKDSVEIIVVPIKVPKGFSPNGDNINDEFRIPTDNEKVERVAIRFFNRAGVLVWSSEDYVHGELWTGTGKNHIDLPEGTYFYIMDIWPKGKSEPLTIKSFVEILR
jgi:gliding motility-associated-like protein